METFVGDSVTITLSTSIDLTDYTEARIKYEKPDKTTGYWTPDTVLSTVMSYDTNTDTLDQKGTWRLQAYVVFAGDVRLHGKWAEMKVYNPLC